MHAGANMGTEVPSCAFLNTSLTPSPILSASGSQSTMQVIIECGKHGRIRRRHMTEHDAICAAHAPFKDPIDAP